MHYFKTVLAGAALVASVVAQAPLAFTSFPPPNVAAGTSVTVTWEGGDPTAPVTITLRQGPRDDLEDVEVLTTSATGGSFTWTPEDDVVNGDGYALEISQGDQENYTDQFSISGGSDAPASSSTPTRTLSLSSVTPTSRPSSTRSSTVTTRASTTTSEEASTTSESSSRTSAPPTATTSEATSTPTPDAAPATMMSSPIALILGALAAVIYIN